MSVSKFKTNLQFAREPDFVEYFLFPEFAGSDEKSSSAASACFTIEQQLLDVRNKCLYLVEHLVKQRNYIWHKDEFNLTVENGVHKEDSQSLKGQNSQSNASTRDCADENEDLLPPHLHGVTHYGENINDEWFLVFLLLELTKNLPGCVVRIFDNDGEFLLIEAAEVLPGWVTPDTCAQRVYLYNGFVNLVQNSPSNTRTLMSVASAIKKIRMNPTLYKVSQNVQQCINDRLQEFTTSKNTSLHKQIVNVPVNVARLLKSRPSLVAPATRAFCEHDRTDERLFRKMTNFPADRRLRVNIDFTRCLYAMLMHNNYQPDRKQWSLLNKSNAEEYKENILGSKLAMGFEILVEKAKRSGDTAWQDYLRNLQSNGYFGSSLEGSAEYIRLYEAAKHAFKENQKQFRTYSVVGEEILEMLLSDSVGQTLLKLDDDNKQLTPSDSDSWLNVSPEQLDQMLEQRYAYRKLKECGDKLDAKSFTSEIKDFLNRQSNFEGIEEYSDVDTDLDSCSHSDHSRDANDDVEEDDNDYNDNDDDVDEQQKKKSLRHKVFSKDPLDWLYPQKPKPPTPQPVQKRLEKRHQIANLKQEIRRLERVANFKTNLDGDSDSDLNDYDEDEQIERKMNDKERQYRADFKAYMKKMDEELSKTTVGKTFITPSPETKANSNSAKFANNESGADVDVLSSSFSQSDVDEFDDIENFEAIDINVNTLGNMMQSLNLEMGATGPVSNLICAMGNLTHKSTPANNNAKTDAKYLTESTV